MDELEQLKERVRLLEAANEAQWNKLAEQAASNSNLNEAVLATLDRAQFLTTQAHAVLAAANRALESQRAVVSDSFGLLFQQHIKAWWNDMAGYRTPQLLNLIWNRSVLFAERNRLITPGTVKLNPDESTRIS